jgi:hypothetical protein
MPVGMLCWTTDINKSCGKTCEKRLWLQSNSLASLHKERIAHEMPTSTSATKQTAYGKFYNFA